MPAALEALLAARGKVRVQLLWDSQSAGYLFARLAGAQAREAGKPDLLLDVGVEESANGTARIAWGKKAGAQDLFIPLDRTLWIGAAVNGAAVDREALQEAAALI
jgi:hypothetical protein